MKVITDEEVDKLNYLQHNSPYHPYTCDRNHNKCETKITPRDFSKDGVLIATNNGWVCPCGKYKQNYSTEIEV